MLRARNALEDLGQVFGGDGGPVGDARMETLGGGSTLSLTQRSRLTRHARRSRHRSSVPRRFCERSTQPRIGGGHLPVGWRPDAEPMLGPREVVHARVRAGPDVAAAFGIGVDQRRVEPMVLGGRVREEHLERAPARVETPA